MSGMVGMQLSLGTILITITYALMWVKHLINIFMDKAQDREK
jgi:hypothetical protein